jgi:hypothetical protein
MVAKYGVRLAFGVVALFVAQHAKGAGIYRETFSEGMAGWTNSGQLSVAYSNGALVGRFAAQAIPAPDTGALRATNTSSGGAFVGNYRDAGIWLIGLSFMAADIIPSSCALRLVGVTNSFFRSFKSYIVQTGVWYRFAFPVTSVAEGGWVGGSEALFQSVITNVLGVQIELLRNGTEAQRYFVDDVFLDRVPEGFIEATSHVPITWSYLQSNRLYYVQTCAHLTDEWETADSWVATNRTHTWTDAAATNFMQRFYRLSTPQGY